MRALSDSVSLSLFDLSIYFTFLLFIILSYQHFFLLFTFLEVSRLKPCALPPRSWGPRTTSTFPHMERPVTRPMDSNQNLRVSWKLMNLRDFEWEIQYRIIKTTILQEKETIHCSIIIWYTIFPMPQAMKIPAAKAAVDKEWEKLEKIPAWNLTKVRSKKEVIDEARMKGAKVHIASLMDICHLKNAELETKHIVKDDSGSYAVFTEQGSSASQMTAAKVMDIISRLPGCSGQAGDACSH